VSERDRLIEMDKKYIATERLGDTVRKEAESLAELMFCVINRISRNEREKGIICNACKQSLFAIENYINECVDYNEEHALSFSKLRMECPVHKMVSAVLEHVLKLLKSKKINNYKVV
jgi:hypothetical protein